MVVITSGPSELCWHHMTEHLPGTPAALAAAILISSAHSLQFLRADLSRLTCKCKGSIKCSLSNLVSPVFKYGNFPVLMAQVPCAGQKFKVWDGGSGVCRSVEVSPKICYLTYAIILDIQGAVEENRLCCSCFIVLLFVSLSLLRTMESLDLGLLFFLEST